MNYTRLEVDIENGEVAMSGLLLRGDLELQSGSLMLSELEIGEHILRAEATRNIDVATTNTFQGRFSVVSESEITIQNDVSP